MALSYHEGDSVNVAIPPELCLVFYTPFEAVLHMVRLCGIRAEMAKYDVNSAFCLFLVHPEDFDLLGFYFQGAFYIDRALPMG